MNRRSFFRRLVTPAVALPALTLGPVIDKGIAVDAVLCPTCGWTQPHPVRSAFPSWTAWAEAMTSPMSVTCYNPACRQRLSVTFARRIG